jgi:hypothetical protein
MGEGRIAEGCAGSSSAGPTRDPTLVDLDEFSSLCSTGHTPNIVTGALLRFLMEHFADPTKIENAALRDNIYNVDPDDTTEGPSPKGILIDPIYKWNPRDFSLRPAIYIKRNGMTPQRLGINDGLTIGLDRDKQTGQIETYKGDYHVVGVLGSHSLFCIGRAGAEAEILASEVFREVQHFAPILRKDLKLKKLAVAEYSEVSKLDEYDQHFVVALTIAWYYFEKWRLRPVAPWLKGISIGVGV